MRAPYQNVPHENQCRNRRQYAPQIATGEKKQQKAILQIQQRFNDIANGFPPNLRRMRSPERCNRKTPPHERKKQTDERKKRRPESDAGYRRHRNRNRPDKITADPKRLLRLVFALRQPRYPRNVRRPAKRQNPNLPNPNPNHCRSNRSRPQQNRRSAA